MDASSADFKRPVGRSGKPVSATRQTNRGSTELAEVLRLQ